MELEIGDGRNATPKTLGIGITVRLKIGGPEGICTLTPPADNGALCSLSYESEMLSDPWQINMLRQLTTALSNVVICKFER